MGNAENAIFRAACPHCGVLYRVPTDKRGVRFRCKKCQIGVIDTNSGVYASATTNEIRDDSKRTATAKSETTRALGDLQRRNPVARINHDTCMPNTVLERGSRELPTAHASESEINAMPILKPAKPVSDRSDNLDYYVGKPLANKVIGSDTTILPSVEMDKLRKEQKNDGLVEW